MHFFRTPAPLPSNLRNPQALRAKGSPFSITSAHLKEDDEAGRAQLFARLPALREFFEAACGLRAKGWKAQAIATRLRQHRMERIEAQPRVSWETRYQRALDAVFAMVQARAFELAGQEGTVKELAVRLLSDALEAAENLES